MFTKQEETIIAEAIVSNGYRLTRNLLTKLSEQLGKSESCIKNHWYGNMSLGRKEMMLCKHSDIYTFLLNACMDGSSPESHFNEIAEKFHLSLKTVKTYYSSENYCWSKSTILDAIENTMMLKLEEEEKNKKQKKSLWKRFIALFKRPSRTSEPI